MDGAIEVGREALDDLGAVRRIDEGRHGEGATALERWLAPDGWLSSDQPDLYFEDNAIGRMKHELWHADNDAIEAVIAEYGHPSPVEWGVAAATCR